MSGEERGEWGSREGLSGEREGVSGEERGEWGGKG